MATFFLDFDVTRKPESKTPRSSFLRCSKASVEARTMALLDGIAWSGQIGVYATDMACNAGAKTFVGYAIKDGFRAAPRFERAEAEAEN